MAFSLLCLLGRTLVPALGANFWTGFILFGCAGSLLQSAGFLELGRAGSTLEWWCAGLSLWGLLLLWSTGLLALRQVESSQTREWTHIPRIGGWILNHWTTREVPWIGFKNVTHFTWHLAWREKVGSKSQDVVCPRPPNHSPLKWPRSTLSRGYSYIIILFFKKGQDGIGVNTYRNFRRGSSFRAPESM